MSRRSKQTGPELGFAQLMRKRHAYRPVVVKVAVLRDGCLPEYQTAGAAAMDLRASIGKPLVLKPQSTAVVPSGIAIALPSGRCALVCSRSGLATKHMVVVLNAPGIIDSDYRGEVLICLANLGKRPFTIQPLDRIAQLLVTKLERIQWSRAASLSTTQRGERGLGHTGRH